MESLINLEKLIKEAKKKGVDFGKGDPYNRLRYYTKMGWLPHAVRKQDKKGDVKGHYPPWVIEHLVLIEELKTKGLSNEEIALKLQAKNKIVNFVELVKDKNTRNQILTYLAFIMLFFVFLNETGILRIGKTKNDLITETLSGTTTQILDSGTAFVPMNQTAVSVKTSFINRNMKVNVTFTQDYSPASRFWISEIRDYEGFTLQLDTPVSGNPEFNWWVSN